MNRLELSKFDINLALGHEAEALVLQSLTGVSDGRIEVKRDARAADTGNVYVEYRQKIRGEWVDSGIALSEAECYAFVLPPTYTVVIVHIEHLKTLVEKARAAGRTRQTNHDGDGHTEGALVRVCNLLT